MANQSKPLTFILVTSAAAIVGLSSSVLSILVEPIKRDLDLTDTEIGLVAGVAFNLVSSCASLPFARWADVGVRRTVLTVAVLVCSVGTASMGFAHALWQLVAARVAQGIGGGGANTPGQSILADLYPPHRLSSALAVYGVGSTIVATVGTTIAAYAAEAYGWRSVFWFLSAPGLALAILMLVTMREPDRPSATRSTEGTHRISEALRILAARGTLRHITIGMTLLVFGMAGLYGWSAPYLMRSFDKTLGDIAPVVGIGLGGLLAVGSLAGGILSDRMSRRDLRWHLWIPLIGVMLSVPPMAGYLISSEYWLAVVFLGIAVLLLGTFSPPLQAAVIGSVPPQLRATSLAIMGAFTGGLGWAGGMFVVGVISDWLAPTQGIQSLRYATAVLLPACVWGCLHIWIASKHYRQEAAEIEEEAEAEAAEWTSG